MTSPARDRLRPVWRMFNLRHGLDSPEAIDTTIREGVQPFGTNLWVLILAMLVASVGLDVNATAVIIGAMLISPLMGPIVGLGYGLAMQDGALIRLAARTLVVFVVISLASSTLYFSLSPLDEPGSELLARVRPTVWDVLIAFFGGAAGIIAITRHGVSNVLPGVAIATALMPPLCTAGYALANGRWDWVGGALYLFAINGVFIAMSALLLVKLMRLPRRPDLPQRSARVARLFTALTLVALVAPSTFLAREVVQTQRYTKAVREAVDVAAWLSDVVVLKREMRHESRRMELTIAGSASPVEFQRQLDAAADASPLLSGTRFDVRSVSGPALDLEQLRSALQADVAIAATRVDASLREELAALREKVSRSDEREAELRRVKEELRAQYPVATSVEVAMAPGDAGEAPRVLVELSARTALTRTERERLQRWLAVRLPGIQSSIVYRSSALRG
jgi:uncharacterized hydrophobic protein (TIGR00271 family)